MVVPWLLQAAEMAVAFAVGVRRGGLGFMVKCSQRAQGGATRTVSFCLEALET